MSYSQTSDSTLNDTKFARELFDDYASYSIQEITSRRFTQGDMLCWLEPLNTGHLYRVKALGTSAEGRTISLLRLGKGTVKVLLWSQIHGDESTATMALLDILNFFKRKPEHVVTRSILDALDLLMIPMLNPDGAERFQRRTAQSIDMNRDAVALETPEARILKDVQQTYKPEFGFNLHDQDPRYTVGNSKDVSTIALLAPAYDEARGDNHFRLEAKKVASVFAAAVEEFIPGHVSKYDDTFEPRAFGDNVQKWGTSTVLVESGGWPGDREKMFIRKLNAVGLMTSLYALANGTYRQADLAVYEQLPFGVGAQAVDLRPIDRRGAHRGLPGGGEKGHPAAHPLDQGSRSCANQVRRQDRRSRGVHPQESSEAGAETQRRDRGGAFRAGLDDG